MDDEDDEEQRQLRRRRVFYKELKWTLAEFDSVPELRRWGGATP